MLEIVPAILRTTFEKVERDWNKVRGNVAHIQIDITDGIFAGDGTFRHIPWFKKLVESEKAELHLMVHTPGYWVPDIVDLNPARCIFHLEAFSGKGNIEEVYNKLRTESQSELALAINPESPIEWLEDYLEIIDYVLFMGYNPGWANQPISPEVYGKIGAFKKRHPEVRVAVDGHVARDTAELYVRAGARILCANTAIFKEGDPLANIKQLELIAKSALPG